MLIKIMIPFIQICVNEKKSYFLLCLGMRNGFPSPENALKSILSSSWKHTNKTTNIVRTESNNNKRYYLKEKLNVVIQLDQYCLGILLVFVIRKGSVTMQCF